MTPDFDRQVQCKRRLDFDTIDALQIQALGNKPKDIEMKDTTVIREDITNLFDDGDIPRAMKAISEILQHFQNEIDELKSKQNGS